MTQVAERLDNRLISMEDFLRIPVRWAKVAQRSQMKAMAALNPGQALLFGHHGAYVCGIGLGPRWCGLTQACLRAAKRRGLLATTRHLPDGQLAVALFDLGAPP